MVKAQSPTVLLIYGSNADYWTSIIRERCHDIDIITMQKYRTGEARLESVTGLIGWQFPLEIFLEIPKLRWIQYISVAVDEWAGNDLISANVVVTNTKGLYGDSVADYVIWALLTLTRKFDVVVRNQTKRRWQQISGPSLNGQTIGILGMGSIGCAVAKRASAFGMKTVGIVLEAATLAQSEIVDDTVLVRNLPQVIGEFDVLVICVPLTDATRGIVDSGMIAKMTANAFLINVSRGGIADELAIAKALKNTRLAGAALDVFDREPLRRWSPLWRTGNLLVSPHIAAITDDYRERVGDLICQNVDRFCAQRTLQNIVDPEKGY